MSHLNLNQTTSSIEVVSSSVIDKLYELAQTSLDETSDVQGNLQVTHAYEDAVSYLLAKYTNLQINVTGGAYIRFTDLAVQAICATNWGDGVGITTLQASIVSNLGIKFGYNSSITSFNELKKFTNVVKLNTLEFKNCTNLTSIDLSNITDTTTQSWFQGCSKLSNVIGLSNLSYIPAYSFDNCNFSTIDVSNATIIGASAFNYNRNNTKIIFGAISEIGQSAFFGNFKLVKVDIPSTITKIGQMAFNKNNDTYQSQYFVVRAITPPTIDSTTFSFHVNNCPIYVPDESIDTYKADSVWSNYTTRLKTLTQFATDFPNG